MMVWHKPYFVEVSPATFSTIHDILETFGMDWQAAAAPFKNSLEQETFVLSVLKILGAHFNMANAGASAGESAQNKIPTKEKSALERTLYRYDIFLHVCQNR